MTGMYEPGMEYTNSLSGRSKCEPFSSEPDERAPRHVPEIYRVASPGPSPLASLLIRMVQFVFSIFLDFGGMGWLGSAGSILALGVMGSTEQYETVLTGGTASLGYISFANFAALDFLMVACCLAFLYMLLLVGLSALKLCDCMGGRHWTNGALWAQVYGDMVVGQLVFAAACGGAGVAMYNETGIKNGSFGSLCTIGYRSFCQLVNVAIVLAFLTSISLFGSFWVFTRAAYKTYF